MAVGEYPALTVVDPVDELGEAASDVELEEVVLELSEVVAGVDACKKLNVINY